MLRLRVISPNDIAVDSPHLTSVANQPVVVREYFERKPPYVRAFSVLLLVIFAPVMVLCMLLIRLTSSGPALYRQTRVGKDGKLFKILKIRTMYCDAESLSGPMLCMPRDSRITPIGRLLRFLHLDELPQLVNVVRGEMCLVGPRPERPEIIKKNKLNRIVPGFADRTKVLPGVTGLAQINLPADQTPECVVPKVKLDLEYIETATIGLDLRILMCTAIRMLGVRHGRAVRFFRLNRNIQFVEPAMAEIYEEATSPPSVAAQASETGALPIPRVATHENGDADASEISDWNGLGDGDSDAEIAPPFPPKKPR